MERKEQRITGLKVVEGVRFEVLTAVVKEISFVHFVWHLYPEEGGRTLLRNVGTYQTNARGVQKFKKKKYLNSKEE